jgi:riboflavin kinase/FMN adenylyltransferase
LKKQLENTKAMSINIKNNFALVIGNFDGCHLGHQFYIETAQKEAKELNCDLVILTFKPHPIMVLKPQQNYLLTSAEGKLKILMDKYSLNLIEFEFTRDFSNLTGIDFLKKHVLSKNLKAIIWGHDLKIGMDRLAEYNSLKNDIAFKDIIFLKLNPLELKGEKVCSSIIREYLNDGKIESANEFLGRKYSIEGSVMRGHGRGAQIGIRTANLSYDKDRLIPKKGVYLTKTTYDNKTYKSVTNIGHNPTFGLETLSIETHLLGFDKMIYGEGINVEFIKKLRDEKKFLSVEELVEQIKNDVKVAQAND